MESAIPLPYGSSSTAAGLLPCSNLAHEYNQQNCRKAKSFFLVTPMIFALFLGVSVYFFYAETTTLAFWCSKLNKLLSLFPSEVEGSLHFQV